MNISPDTAESRARQSKLLELSAGLTFSRAMVRTFYDTWVLQSGVSRTCPGFLYAVASGLDRWTATPVDPAKNSHALALALYGLPGNDHVLSFLAAAIAAGLFDRTDGLPDSNGNSRIALMARVVVCVGADAVEQVLPKAVAQGGTRAVAQAHGAIPTWVDPGHVLPAIIQARRRLCRIVCEDNNENIVHLGTGFLIGPSAVITNQHVLDEFKRGTFDEDSLTCWFDYSETTGLKEGEAARHPVADDPVIASSPMGREGPEGAVGKWWEHKPTRKAFLETVKDSLDYAVLRLDTSPGLQRGWYDLEKLPKSTPGFAIALHHPSGLEQTISMGDMKYSFAKDVRLFHEAPTSFGSSGGLLVNQTANPIGLHHVGISFDDAAGEECFMNVAISLRHIAEDLARNSKFEEIRRAANLLPPLGCIDGIKPLFGRSDLLKKLQKMWEDPKKRILMVHHEEGEKPIQKPGKSFTIEIIQGLFRTPEHKHIVFRAGETEADALKFVSETMESFAADLVDELPTKAETTTPAYVQELVSILVDKMQQRLPNQSVWLMIDDLEHHSISDASGREFLATIYDRIEQIPGLRVVLIGLSKEIAISGVNGDNVVTSTITTEDQGDFGNHFATWFRQRIVRGVAVDDTAINLLASTISSYAGQEAPLQAMSRFVVDHMPPDLFDAKPEAEQ